MSEQGSRSLPPPGVRTYQIVIFAAPLLFASVLLMLFCLLYVRRERRSSITRVRAQPFVGGLLDMPPMEQGLRQSFRRKLPIVLFDEAIGAMFRSTQCAVCLGDYQLNERLQQLPQCNHSFHSQCIDAWLEKNTTCPICRRSLLEESFIDCSQHGINMEVASRHDENRLWEERVVSEIQEGGPFGKSDACHEASSTSESSCEVAPQLSANDLARNIERS